MSEDGTDRGQIPRSLTGRVGRGAGVGGNERWAGEGERGHGRFNCLNVWVGGQSIDGGQDLPLSKKIANGAVLSRRS
jgi:hypothetical protein